MDFYHRFALIRASKVNNNYIRETAPELLKTTKILTIDKLNYSYFIVDFLQEKAIGKFDYVTSKNIVGTKTGRNLDVDVFEEYETHPDNQDVYIKNLDKICESSNKISRLFIVDDNWFLIVFDDDSFRINSKMFTDYKYRFSRKFKINTILKDGYNNKS